MSEGTETQTPVNPPETGAPNAPGGPAENPNPQAPNVTPNPAAPSNPSSTPAPNTQNPDLLAELRALPERLANVLTEKNPPKTTTPETKEKTTDDNSGGPGGTNDPWHVRFARAWFG
jgi:hypothetical protein